MNLHLSLIRQYFDMTDSGFKPEDYRKITPYWCSRLVLVNGVKKSQKAWENYEERHGKGSLEFIAQACIEGGTSFVKFEQNIMTLGYPSKTDESRIIRFEHAGIEIRQGNPEWGAEPNKLYFVIKHGKRITNKPKDYPDGYGGC